MWLVVDTFEELRQKLNNKQQNVLSQLLITSFVALYLVQFRAGVKDFKTLLLESCRNIRLKKFKVLYTSTCLLATDAYQDLHKQVKIIAHEKKLLQELFN
jgi:hypothetical protein